MLTITPAINKKKEKIKKRTKKKILQPRVVSENQRKKGFDH
jgi:hypothetical protein